MPELTVSLKEKIQKEIGELYNEIEKRNSKTSSLDVNIYNKEGLSLIHCACAIGDISLIRELLSQGADINLETANDTNVKPIFFAASFGHENVVKELLDNGALINVDMIQKNMPEWFNRLLIDKFKFQIQHINKQEIIRGYELLSILEIATAIHDLQFFVDFKNINQSLFDNVIRFYGNELLLMAAKFYATEIFDYLVDNYQITMMPKNNLTPCAINTACGFDNWLIVKSVLKKGFNINYQDGDKDSLLHSAAKGASEECILNLIEENINLFLQNKEQENFFHLLLNTKSNIELFQNILKHLRTEDVIHLLSVPNIYGETPLKLGYTNGYENILTEYNIFDKVDSQLSTGSSINVDQGLLREKIYAYLTLKNNKDITYSPNGYCVGYSTLLCLLGSERFFKIIEKINSWDNRVHSLQCKIEDKSLNSFATLDELFDEFIRCITWAQHPWITIGLETNFLKVFDKFGINYNFLGEVFVETCNDHDTKEILNIIMSLPINTKIILLGDSHACRIEIKENQLIDYHDPNFIKRLPAISDVETFHRILSETKFSKAPLANRSRTVFVFLRCGQNINDPNDPEIRSKLSAFNYSHTFQNSSERISFIRTISKENTPSYNEEEFFNINPPNLLKFFDENERLLVSDATQYKYESRKF